MSRPVTRQANPSTCPGLLPQEAAPPRTAPLPQALLSAGARGQPAVFGRSGACRSLKGWPRFLLLERSRNILILILNVQSHKLAFGQLTSSLCSLGFCMGITVMLTKEDETNHLKSYKNNNNEINILALGGGKVGTSSENSLSVDLAQPMNLSKPDSLTLSKWK